MNDLIRLRRRAASVLIQSRLWLKADVGADGPGWDEAPLAEAVVGGASTVYQVRQAVVEAELPAVLFRKTPTGRPDRTLDGVQAAHRIARALLYLPIIPIPIPIGRLSAVCFWSAFNAL